jgi:hypothetical protein
MGRGVAVTWTALALLAAAGCDSAAARTTARVERFDGSRVCLVPEDRGQRDLRGCYPVRSDDRTALRVGSCIEVVIPNQLAAAKRNDPIRSVRVLDRECR